MAWEGDSPRGAKTPRTSILDPEDEEEREALVSCITSNGTTREAVSRQPSTAGAWSADLILRLEPVVQLEDDLPPVEIAGGSSQAAGVGSNGEAFELWLGSFEDALNLRRLVDNNINAVLNCALDDCEAELAPFRPVGRGRPRSHTRNTSLSDEELGGLAQPNASNGMLALHRDQVWAEAALNEDWYSEALGYDVAYHSFSAADETEYDLHQHFEEANTFLEKCRREGRRVFVHCVMGLNRAPATSIAFLCQSLGYPLEDAVDVVSRNRGLVLSNQGFLDSLVAAYGSKRKRSSASVLRLRLPTDGEASFVFATEHEVSV